jgi:ribosomal protein S18 acetylase RimI-like enzyme
MNFTLAPATVSDLNEVFAIEAELQSYLTGRLQSLDEMQEYYFNANTETFLIVVGNKVAGFVSIKILEKENELAALFIRKAYQNKGLGKDVMERILSMADNTKAIFLFTHPKNLNAIKLYQTQGFVIEKLIEDFHEESYGDGEPRLRMVRTI